MERHLQAGASALVGGTGKLEKRQIQWKQRLGNFEGTHFKLVGRHFSLEWCPFFLAKPRFFFVLCLFQFKWRQDVEKSFHFCLILSLVLLEWGRCRIERTHFLREMGLRQPQDAQNVFAKALGKQEETHFQLEMTPFPFE